MDENEIEAEVRRRQARAGALWEEWLGLVHRSLVFKPYCASYIVFPYDITWEQSCGEYATETHYSGEFIFKRHRFSIVRFYYDEIWVDGECVFKKSKDSNAISTYVERCWVEDLFELYPALAKFDKACKESNEQATKARRLDELKKNFGI